MRGGCKDNSAAISLVQEENDAGVGSRIVRKRKKGTVQKREITETALFLGYCR